MFQNPFQKTGVMLCGHGSRDERAVAEFKALAEHMKRRLPQYDVDFGFRALLKNIPLYFDRSIKSIHNDQISLRYYGRRQKAYMESKRTIFERNPALREKIGDNGAVHVPFFKSFFYAILCSPFLVRFFESAAFAKLFPKTLRYKIYGSTIAAISLRS